MAMVSVAETRIELATRDFRAQRNILVFSIIFTVAALLGLIVSASPPRRTSR